MLPQPSPYPLELFPWGFLGYRLGVAEAEPDAVSAAGKSLEIAGRSVSGSNAYPRWGNSGCIGSGVAGATVPTEPIPRPKRNTTIR